MPMHYEIMYMQPAPKYRVLNNKLDNWRKCICIW